MTVFVLLAFAEETLRGLALLAAGIVLGVVGLAWVATAKGIEIRTEVWKGGPLILPEPGDVVQPATLQEVQRLVP